MAFSQEHAHGGDDGPAELRLLVSNRRRRTGAVTAAPPALRALLPGLRADQDWSAATVTLVGDRVGTGPGNRRTFDVALTRSPGGGVSLAGPGWDALEAALSQPGRRPAPAPGARPRPLGPALQGGTRPGSGRGDAAGAAAPVPGGVAAAFRASPPRPSQGWQPVLDPPAAGASGGPAGRRGARQQDAPGPRPPRRGVGRPPGDRPALACAVRVLPGGPHAAPDRAERPDQPPVAEGRRQHGVLAPG